LAAVRLLENPAVGWCGSRHASEQGIGFTEDTVEQAAARSITVVSGAARGLVNALAHRDYLISAPIRLFIFDNRIEIVSPGHLPNNLTVAKIRTGNSNIRNPILVSYIAKGLLPYRGLGSGIKRALEDWPEIDFTDDRDGGLFVATVHRKEVIDAEAEAYAGKTPEKTPEKILSLLKENPQLSIRDLADRIGKSESAVERALRRLREQNRLQRIGPDKGGYWQVIQ
jgi:ATP-dependent DNA helicase RecG